MTNENNNFLKKEFWENQYFYGSNGIRQVIHTNNGRINNYNERITAIGANESARKNFISQNSVISHQNNGFLNISDGSNFNVQQKKKYMECKYCSFKTKFESDLESHIESDHETQIQLSDMDSHIVHPNHQEIPGVSQKLDYIPYIFSFAVH
jgi:hypothetical protein